MIGSKISYAVVQCGSRCSIEVSTDDKLYKEIMLTQDEFSAAFHGMFNGVREERGMGIWRYC